MKRSPEADLIKKVTDLALDGLLTDGGHHKQWYLERILETLGIDLDWLVEAVKSADGELERGIAP